MSFMLGSGEESLSIWCRIEKILHQWFPTLKQSIIAIDVTLNVNCFFYYLLCFSQITRVPESQDGCSHWLCS